MLATRLLSRPLRLNLALLTVLGGPLLAGPAVDASAAAASPVWSVATARRTETVPITVGNPTFSRGTSRWRSSSSDDWLAPTRLGRRDHSAIMLRVGRSGRVVLKQHGSSVVPRVGPGRLQAVVWVWTGSPQRVVVGVDASRSGRSHRVMARSFHTRSRGWRRLSLSQQVALSPQDRLGLRVTVPSLPRRRHVIVDDVSLSVRSPSASTNGDHDPTTAPQPAPAGTWESGASGEGVADGRFAQWRGTPVGIAGTWNDNFESTRDQWTLQPGFEYGGWNQDLDVAVGGIYKSRGESWANAAAGAYDERWATMLSNLADAWAGRPGTLYIRFAHEFNGDWEDWSVSGSEVPSFHSAWNRFRALQQKIMPNAELVFCPNSQSSGSLDIDWRQAYPGAGSVDVMATDFYNQYPYVGDARSFREGLTQTDTHGAPRGLAGHRDFAARQGLPFAISEWSTNATMGDGDVFVTLFRRWLAAHAGSGAGQVRYDIEFNVQNYDQDQFQLFPVTRQPAAAEAYRRLW